MKRDPDLIRSILLEIEEAPGAEKLRMPLIADRDRATIHYHVRLLIEAGLLRAAEEIRYRGPDWLALRLTWAGYDYLDTIRDPAVWRIVKSGAQRTGSWSLETLGTLAKAVITSRLQTLGLGQLS